MEKKIFTFKNVLISNLKTFEWGRVVAQSIELQNFMAAKLKINLFVLLWVALLVSQVTLLV